MWINSSNPSIHYSFLCNKKEKRTGVGAGGGQGDSCRRRKSTCKREEGKKKERFPLFKCSLHQIWFANLNEYLIFTDPLNMLVHISRVY